MDNFLSSIIFTIAGAVLPTFGKYGRKLYEHLFQGLPFIATGMWKTTYRCIQNGSTEIEAFEIVELYRSGRQIRGVAQMHTTMNRKWVLKGELCGRYWVGRVYAADRHPLLGSGVFQLKVSEDGMTMEGYMLWYDSALDRIYSTTYVWKKIDKITD